MPRKRIQLSMMPGPHATDNSSVARASLPGRLVVMKAGGDERELPFDSPVVVGRHEDCDLVLADRTASKRHARIEPTDGSTRVVDLGSRNGTFLNGRRIAGPEMLASGDVLTFGNSDVRFDRASQDDLSGDLAPQERTTKRPRTLLISYAAPDADRAEALLLRLQAAGHLIWIDRSQNEDGWQGALLDAIWSCDAVIFVVSRAAATSERVRQEVHLAGSERVPVIPLIFEPADLPDELGWYLIGSVPPIDVRFAFDAGMNKLLATVETLPRRLIVRPRWLAAMSALILTVGIASYFALRWLLGG